MMSNARDASGHKKHPDEAKMISKYHLFYASDSIQYSQPWWRTS